ATTSTDFLTASAFQSALGGGFADAFVTKLVAVPLATDFSVGLDPASVFVTSGQTSSAITVSVSSENGNFGSAVTLSCSNLPASATCSFNPSSVTPTGSTPSVSSLTINTGAAARADARPSQHNSGWSYALWLPIAGMALLGAGTGTGRRKLFSF